MAVYSRHTCSVGRSAAGTTLAAHVRGWLLGVGRWALDVWRSAAALDTCGRWQWALGYALDGGESRHVRLLAFGFSSPRDSRAALEIWRWAALSFPCYSRAALGVRRWEFGVLSLGDGSRVAVSVGLLALSVGR
jgi:hypothetical protein